MVKASKGARIGVISDTHGHLDPQVLEEFAGVDHIIHAGDIMDAATLEALGRIAPVTAVAGNMDDGKLGKLPREVTGKVGGVRFVVGHKRKRLMKRLSLGKLDGVGKHEVPDLVVCGHDHLPAVEWVDGTLFLNPGSASAPHYEDDDPTIAIVETGRHGLDVRFVRIPRRVDDES
jgi:putative phosphoesterase